MNRRGRRFLQAAGGAIRTGDDPVAELAFEGAARRLFFGQLAGREVEIERVGAQAWDVDPGVVQHLTAPFPEAGQFVIRIDGFETSRFLLRPRIGHRHTYRLAIRHSASPLERSLALGMFLAFDPMRDFILGTLSY